MYAAPNNTDGTNSDSESDEIHLGNASVPEFSASSKRPLQTAIFNLSELRSDLHQIAEKDKSKTIDFALRMPAATIEAESFYKALVEIGKKDLTVLSIPFQSPSIKDLDTLSFDELEQYRLALNKQKADLEKIKSDADRIYKLWGRIVQKTQSNDLKTQAAQVMTKLSACLQEIQDNLNQLEQAIQSAQDKKDKANTITVFWWKPPETHTLLGVDSSGHLSIRIQDSTTSRYLSYYPAETDIDDAADDSSDKLDSKVTKTLGLPTSQAKKGKFQTSRQDNIQYAKFRWTVEKVVIRATDSNGLRFAKAANRLNALENNAPDYQFYANNCASMVLDLLKTLGSEHYVPYEEATVGVDSTSGVFAYAGKVSQSLAQRSLQADRNIATQANTESEHIRNCLNLAIRELHQQWCYIINSKNPDIIHCDIIIKVIAYLEELKAQQKPLDELLDNIKSIIAKLPQSIFEEEIKRPLTRLLHNLTPVNTVFLKNSLSSAAAERYASSDDDTLLKPENSKSSPKTATSVLLKNIYARCEMKADTNEFNRWGHHYLLMIQLKELASTSKDDKDLNRIVHAEIGKMHQAFYLSPRGDNRFLSSLKQILPGSHAPVEENDFEQMLQTAKNSFLSFSEHFNSHGMKVTEHGAYKTEWGKSKQLTKPTVQWGWDFWNWPKRWLEHQQKIQNVTELQIQFQMHQLITNDKYSPQQKIATIERFIQKKTNTLHDSDQLKFYQKLAKDAKVVCLLDGFNAGLYDEAELVAGLYQLVGGLNVAENTENQHLFEVIARFKAMHLKYLNLSRQVNIQELTAKDKPQQNLHIQQMQRETQPLAKNIRLTEVALGHEVQNAYLQKMKAITEKYKEKEKEHDTKIEMSDMTDFANDQYTLAYSKLRLNG